MKKRSFIIIVLSLVAVLSLTLVACQTKNTVSFEIGIDGYTGEGVASQTVVTGGEVTLPAAPTIEYYQFEYWKLGDKQYAVGDKYTLEEDGDITFTAVYAEAYVLNYEVHESLTAPPADTGKVGDDGVTLPQGPDYGDYAFKGWIINEQTYQPGDVYKPAHGATTAVAKYDIAYVYVTFQIAQGSGITGNVGSPARVEINSTLKERDIPALVAPEFSELVWLNESNTEVDLAELVIGENITIIVDSVYLGTDAAAFIFTPVGDPATGYTVMANLGWDSYVENGRIGIPAEYNGLPVVGITDGTLAENAFGGKAAPGLTYVYLPASIQTIGKYAFNDNATLQKVVYAQDTQLETICENSFEDCVALTTFSAAENQLGIRIPASVTEIKPYAFFMLSIGGRVVNVYFAESGAELTTIGQYAFAAKSSGNVTAAQRGGIILQTAIPESVVTIGGWAFFANPLNYIDFGVDSKLQTIGDHAFSMMSLSNTDTAINNASQVREIIIPKSVTSIGEHAFRNHINVERIEFEEGSTITEIKQYTFWQMPKLREVVLPAGLTTLGQYAFANSFDGTVNFGGADGLFSNLTDIPAYAFSGANFNKVTIGKDVTNIAGNAFNGATIGQLVFEAGGTQELVLGASAFTGVHGAFAVEIPARVKTIPSQLFYQANITALTFEAGTEDLVIANNAFNAFGTTTNKNSTSASDTAYTFTVQSIEFPARLVSIGENAFQGQVYLKSISFADGSRLTTISKHAFAYTSGLNSISLPDSLITIGDYAFSDYWNAFKAQVRDQDVVTLTKADWGSLTTLTIPANVETIGQYGFYNRGLMLNKLEFKGTAQSADLSIGTAAFAIHGNYVTFIGVSGGGNTALTSVKFPANLVSASGPFFINNSDNYKALTTLDLSDCAKLTELGSSFGAYSALTSFTVPAGIKTIGSNAFMSSHLATLTFAENSQLTTIGAGAFSNKSDNYGTVAATDQTNKLTSVKIPASVTSIGAKAFLGIATLTKFEVEEGSTSYKAGQDGVLFSADGSTLVIYPYGKTDTSYKVPDGCTKIAANAFTGNPNLTSITFNQVTTVEGDYAFSGIKLTTVSHTFESLGNYAFACATGASTLQTANIDVTGSTKPTNLFLNCATLTEVTLGPSFGNTIPANTFQNCTNLKTIKSDTITILASNAFRATIIELTQEQIDRLVQIDGSAFYGVDSPILSGGKGTVTFTNVTTWGTNALQNNTQLIEVNLPKATALTNYMFSGCTKLETVTAPLATSIGQQTFATCTALKSVTVGADMVSIDSQAFQNSGLGSLTLTSAKVVTLKNVNAFTGCSIVVSVPEELLEDYQANANWASAVANNTVTLQAIVVEEDDSCDCVECDCETCECEDCQCDDCQGLEDEDAVCDCDEDCDCDECECDECDCIECAGKSDEDAGQGEDQGSGQEDDQD